MSKVVFVNSWDKLKYWARKPVGFDYAGYDPVRTQCQKCKTIQVVDRVAAEECHSYFCVNCGHLEYLTLIVPDPARLYMRGPIVIVAYFN